MMGLSTYYSLTGKKEQDLNWVIKYYNKRNQWPLVQQLWASWAYASSFESPKEGIKYLMQLQQIDDQDTNVYYMLGLTYNKIDQYDKAIPELRKCYEIYRKYGTEFLKDHFVYVQLGKAYHRTGQYKKEKKVYKESEKLDPDFLYIIFRQIILALSENDSITAKRYIGKYKSISKKNSSSEAAISTDLAYIYSEAGNQDKAEEFYRKALSLEPENPAYIKQFADFIINNNRNVTEIPELMDKAIKLAPNKHDYYDYLNTKGWGLYKQGKYKEALEILQETWDEAPFKLYSFRSHLEEVKKMVASQK
jgi:tetratricopeptide (TPR) repeat protein